MTSDDNHIDVELLQGKPLRVLTANVGNISFKCRKYLYNLCDKEVEEHLVTTIRGLNPDVVFLQEVTHPQQCKEITETRPSRVCFADDEYSGYQVRRLLGNNYTIVCDSRNGYECIGVHIDAGMIEGCMQGELCENVARVDSTLEECDHGFTLMSIDAVLRGLPITLVNGHPQSTDIKCRAYAIRQIFEFFDVQPPLSGSGYALIAGDMNIDPFRKDDESIQIWHKYVGLPEDGRDFYYHSGLVEHSPPYYTAKFPFKRTLDHVVSNFAMGNCKTLGEATGTERLDGGGGTDHRAIVCDLIIPDMLYEIHD